MVIETANQLAEELRELGLLDAATSDEMNRLARQDPSPRELARHLLQRDCLTAYQVNQLLQGKGKALLIGPYVLLERIGAGGMGEVYKARHRRLHRLSAIKVIHPKRLDNEAILERFKREAVAAAQLSHPNIVAVHDAGEEGDVRYLAMEYIDGFDLGRLLQQFGLLPISLLCDFIRQASVGLHHAHELGFVHRDIKPQNVLVAPRGGVRRQENLTLDHLHGATVKVLDMGLVRLQPERLDVTRLALTQHGVVIGTVDYLAPEQARNSHRVDRRADLYSLGCTMYQLLTGKTPFPGEAPLDKLLKHQTDQPVSLRELRPEVPVELDEIVLQLLAKRPEDRFQTAADLAMALVAFTPLTPVEATPSVPAGEAKPVFLEPTRIIDDVAQSSTQSFTDLPPPPPLSRKVPRPKSPPKKGHERWWWLAGGVVACFLVLVILGSAFREKPTSAEKEPPARIPRADRLVSYIPPDSKGVVFARLGPLLSAPILHEDPSKKVPVLLEPGTIELLRAVGVNPHRDVEWIRYCFGKDSNKALWLARGAFQRPALRKMFTLVKAGKDGQIELFCDGQETNRAYVGLHEPYLVVSQDPTRVVATLEHATGEGPAQTLDPALANILAKVDRGLHLWVALTPQSLLPLPALHTDKPVNDLLQTLLSRSSGIHGGIHCVQDLSIRLTFETIDEDACKRILGALNGARNAARFGEGWAKFTDTKLPYGQKLWMKLLAESKVQHEQLGVRAEGLVTRTMVVKQP
jgi:serine/threonine protein kinase